MTTYLVETYVATSAHAALAGRVLASVAELGRRGRAIACLDAFYVPRDETWFCVLEALSRDDVDLAAARVGVRFDRVVTVEQAIPPATTSRTGGTT